MTQEEILSPSQIARDSGTQSRAAMDKDAVADYRDAIEEARRKAPGGMAWPFPPIDVYYDGDKYHLADGFHRLAAAAEAGVYRVPVLIYQGTRRDAILHSVGANASHGLRRTQADKRRAVETVLRDEEWGLWSDREIARRCHVSHPTVAAIRADMAAAGKITSSDERKFIHPQTGNEATMQTGNIGRNGPAEKEPLPYPERCPRPSCQDDFRKYPPKNLGDGRWQCTNCEREFDENGRIPKPTNRTGYLTAAEQQTQLNERAYYWLAAYTDQWDRTWRELEPNQVHHANSPCYQAFVREYPSDRDHKFALKQALARLLREDDSSDIATFEEPEEEDVIQADGGGRLSESMPDLEARRYDGFQRQTFVNDNGHTETAWVRTARPETPEELVQLRQASDIVYKLIARLPTIHLETINKLAQAGNLLTEAERLYEKACHAEMD